jgi:hypothetical protein
MKVLTAVIGLMLLVAPFCKAKPGVKSCVSQDPPPGDVSQILNITCHLLKVQFTEPVHKIKLIVELYKPGEANPEELTENESESKDTPSNWAQISIQTADCAHLPLDGEGKDMEELSLAFRTSNGDFSRGITRVEKSKVDFSDEVSSVNSIDFTPQGDRIHLYYAIYPEKGVNSTSMCTTLEETLKANPHAKVVVCSIEIE